MAILSGKDGTVRLGNQPLLHVSDWRIEKTAANKSYTANDTGGSRKRVRGTRDCSGRLEIKAAESDRIPLGEGDAIDLELHADASGENYYELPAIVDAIRLQCDIARGAPLAYVVLFSGSGPLVGHGLLSKDEQVIV